MRKQSVIQAKKNPNPQGKGLVPVLDDWQRARPDALQRKAPGQLLLDWFVSTLVLSARFSFRPVVGQSYHLYYRRGHWRLSLIAPEEWVGDSFGDAIGCCVLQPDMTWRVTPEPDLAQRRELAQLLEELASQFIDSLAGDEPLAERLPGYRRELPYYQRMLATALGVSLRGAVAPGALAAPVGALARDAGVDIAKCLIRPDPGTRDPERSGSD
jgi:hypothetical protein